MERRIPTEDGPCWVVSGFRFARNDKRQRARPHPRFCRLRFFLRGKRPPTEKQSAGPADDLAGLRKNGGAFISPLRLLSWNGAGFTFPLPLLSTLSFSEHGYASPHVVRPRYPRPQGRAQRSTLRAGHRPPRHGPCPVSLPAHPGLPHREGSSGMDASGTSASPCGAPGREDVRRGALPRRSSCCGAGARRRALPPLERAEGQAVARRRRAAQRISGLRPPPTRSGQGGPRQRRPSRYGLRSRRARRRCGARGKGPRPTHRKRRS